MREIDLILLEEVMHRRNFDTDANARTFQLAALMVVLLAVVAVLAHAVVYGDRTETAARITPLSDASPGVYHGHVIQ